MAGIMGRLSMFPANTKHPDPLRAGLKRHNQAKIIKKSLFYFGFLLWPYDVINQSINKTSTAPIFSADRAERRTIP